MLRRFASHPLAEVKELGRAIYDQVAGVAPSIVIFHEANEKDLRTYPELKELAGSITADVLSQQGKINEVDLVEYTADGDDVIAASLLHTSTGIAYQKCKSLVKELGKEQKMDIFKTAWRNMQFYDSMLREFEYANLTFNVSLSSACFGQLKRHRMSTITAQSYDPDLGVTVPESIKESGMEKYFMEIVDETNRVYDEINKKEPLAAPYILTNAHRKRVLIRLNARELYHISRLREDAHAQWDIQNISRLMSEQAKKVMPLTFALIGGKDRYNDIYQGIYGALPKVTEAILPGARNIK